MSSIGYTSFDLYESDALSHHGTLGMKWGQRNGPPYPLTPFAKRVGSAVAKGKARLGVALDDYNKKAQARYAKIEAKRREDAEDIKNRKAAAKKRADLIKMAKKHPEWLTADEYRQLSTFDQNRANFEKNHPGLVKSTAKTIWEAEIKDVVTPGAVAIGKAAVMAAITGEDFETYAKEYGKKAYSGGGDSNKNNNDNNKKNNKKEKKTPFFLKGFERDKKIFSQGNNQGGGNNNP